MGRYDILGLLVIAVNRTTVSGRLCSLMGQGRAPGVDRQDFEAVEAYGVERWLGELALALRQESYRPDPIRRAAMSRCQGKNATFHGLSGCQAAAIAVCHVVIATPRSARCVWAEMRWRWTLKVL